MSGEKLNVAARCGKAIHAQTGHPNMVALAIDDGEGGTFVEIGYNLAVGDAEFVAVTLLRDLHEQLEQIDHPCPSCDARLARVRDALAAMQRDGLEPTGRQRVVQ